MKKILVLFATFFVLSCASDEYIVLIEKNPDLALRDIGFSIKRSTFEHSIKNINSSLPVLRDASNNFIPSQVDDLDGDGEWDEFFFITDLPKDKVLKYSLGFVDADDYPIFEDRTNIRFAKKGPVYKEVKNATRETHAINTETQKVWQMEGIAWENDKIAFRNYFDRRNGMDIFGKVTSKMVLDQVGYKNNLSYHEFNPEWGVDVLKVGNSLGAGSIAYEYKDSLYRVGDNGTGTCTVLTEGPLRSIFRFEFKDWKMADLTIDVTHDVSIEAGKHYYESTVSYSGTDRYLNLVTGIVNAKSNKLYQTGEGKVHQGFYTYDLQSEDSTLLGMGIVVNSSILEEVSEAPELGSGITETYCVHLKSSPNTPVKFRFYTIWERENPEWKTIEGFDNLLVDEITNLESPEIATLLQE